MALQPPVWVTPAGNLGSVPEGIFYATPLVATLPVTTQTIFYQLIAGTLPPGMQINQTGLLTGIPKTIVTVQGVPEQVSKDVTSKFAVRAYTKTQSGAVERLSDRTFSLTVTGQNAPEFVTPSGEIAQYIDGSLVTGIQIEYTDSDPGDTVVVKLIAGTLPPGLTINSKGLISGFIAPNATIAATAGYSRDGQGYSTYPYDFSTQSTSTNYEFLLEVTDGKSSNTRSFSIFVWSTNSLTADNTLITSDNTYLTADGSPIRVPILLTPQGSIGTVKNDNFFAFQFEGIDLDGDQFEYVMDPITFANLTLDPNSGWLYGYIPNLGITENVYDFTVRVFKKNNPAIISSIYSYSLTITGSISSSIVWLVDSNLGTIDNGSTSIFYVKAINAAGLDLYYRLESGSASQLPQGLTLLPTGEIAGRVSFNTFALDSGTTTFDVTKENGADPTTFDMTYTFTVNAYSLNGVVNVFKTFTITVVRAYNEPYNNLYVQAMPPENDRILINELLSNTNIFQPDLIYRANDPNFGVATNVVYDHAFGLTAATLEDYYSSLYKNHYWKNLVLGQIETAQARDADGNIIYEVVYSRVIDNLVNNEGVSVSKDVLLPFPITQDTVTIDTVYPNSLVDMRTQVIDTVGQITNILPQWMISKQSDGRVLGFTPAWVIAYTKPGQANRVAYYIQQQFGDQLNLVDFEVDRYELDCALTKNWDPVTHEWIPYPAELTTFDVEAHYQLPTPNDSSFVFVGGINYAVGDQILILGSQIGGEDGINDVTITVQAIDGSGTIEQAWATGFAVLNTVGDTYINIIGTNITGTGTGASWDLEVVGQNTTIFDGNSLEFTGPVDMYSNTNEYDKYLVFPKRNILE
jgi:hypothetical protein